MRWIDIFHKSKYYEIYHVYDKLKRISNIFGKWFYYNLSFTYYTTRHLLILRHTLNYVRQVYYVPNRLVKSRVWYAFKPTYLVITCRRFCYSFLKELVISQLTSASFTPLTNTLMWKECCWFQTIRYTFLHNSVYFMLLSLKYCL